MSWADAVLGELRLGLSAGYAGTAAVVASLDERGYLTEDVAELARLAGTGRAEVELVVATLRASRPPGVGARDLRDCLLIQLDRRPRTPSIRWPGHSWLIISTR